MDHADAEFYKIRQFLVDDAKLKEMVCHGAQYKPVIVRVPDKRCQLNRSMQHHLVS